MGILEVQQYPTEIIMCYVFTASQHHSMWFIGVYGVASTESTGVLVSTVYPHCDVCHISIHSLGSTLARTPKLLMGHSVYTYEFPLFPWSAVCTCFIAEKNAPVQRKNDVKVKTAV